MANSVKLGHNCPKNDHKEVANRSLSRLGRAPDKKKSSKEPLAPIRKKLKRQIIFLGATE